MRIRFDYWDRREMACETCGRRQAYLCNKYKWRGRCQRRELYEPQYYPKVVR